MDISARVTLKFDGWSRKTIGHFYTTPSFVHHFKSIGEFKLELKSLETFNSGRNWRYFVPCDLEILWMTLETNRSPFYITLTFVQHFKAIDIFKLDLQSGNAQFRSKLVIFVLCDLENWRMTLKCNTTPLLSASSFTYHFIAIGEFKLELQSGNPQFGSKSIIFLAVWPWNLADDLEKQ